ncbi:SPOR domain-containing protein [Zhongshania aquimaris]|uniref:SPOR domain-containing protein n=1 Tax=Zhongshania aquimaris TaxID=2857107 RepID=A0ABS6VQW9_9GAMM|nr:SPOR domain-containing protein [Zhongshania aquimaris]MBW2940719.1 SPOR domain-containing protein [Zhongshania aquimaris]|tara:strand:+ start:95 stop:694 length:600 start_codon:yes stop_codon:yes gene_type:complete
MATQKKTTRGATRSPERQGLPASALLGTGFIAGIICSVLVYSTVISKHPEREAKLAETKAAAAKEKAQQDRKDVTTNTKFDFFTVLPEREVIVTDEQRPAAKPATAIKTADKPPAVKQDISDERYILQAGSFRQGADADRRRAQILLLGLDAKVESVEANGDRWHRVYVGPFQSHNTLTDARSKLINESIDTLVIRQKK